MFAGDLPCDPELRLPDLEAVNPRYQLRVQEVRFQADWQVPLRFLRRLPLQRQDEWMAGSMVGFQYQHRNQRRFPDDWMAKSMVGIF